jgi:5-hydroxyisourate hydrolase
MITTHVLDTSRGVPAAGLSVRLDFRRSKEWVTIGRAKTDSNGRVMSFGNAPLVPGAYRLTFETGAYHKAGGVAPFFPEVAVTFDVESGTAHYHVPLLLSPFGYSTYRGS